LVVPILIPSVVWIEIVLTSVEFDNKAMLQANEVNNKSVTRRLPAKMKS